MKDLQTITRNEFIKLLEDINTPTWVSMLTDTSVKMNKYKDYWLINDEGKRKKNPNSIINPYYESGIRNVSRKYKILTGFDYQKSITDREKKEGKEPTFEAEGNWFHHISKSLVKHNDKDYYYISYQYLDDSILEQEYIFNGNSIHRQLFEDFIGEKSNYENQGLDNPLKFQVCGIENIVTISMNGNNFILVD
jgi:hypothetical protein